MAFDKTNTFTLGTNKRKTKDSHPSHSGSINIDGQEYWLSAWVKEGKDGRFFSGSVKKKEPKKEGNDSDDIPFR
jgi:hypothetical protein